MQSPFRNIAKVLIVSIFLFLLYEAGYSQTESEVKNLRKQLSKSQSDSSRIKILFKLGDRFLSGPSDSLLFYYTRALNIADKHIKQDNRQKEIFSYKKLAIRALIGIGIEHFYQSNYNEALDFYFMALEYSKEIHDIDLLSESYSEIGIVYNNQGKYDQSLEYHLKALEFAKQGIDDSWVAACNVNIGNIYRDKGYYSIAYDYYIKGLKKFEELGHERRMAACYLSIGDIFNEQHDFNTALEYFSRAFQIYSSTGDNAGQAECYSGIGNVYLNLDKYSIARENFNEILRISKETGYTHELDDCLKNIGYSYKMEGDYEKANQFYKKALQISKQEGDKPGIAEILGSMAKLTYLQNDFGKALSLANQSLEIANQTKRLQTSLNAYQILSEIHEKRNDPEKALQAFKKYSGLKDSLFNSEKYRAITEIETKYKTEKKEQQLELFTERNELQGLKLRQRSRFIISLIIFMVLVIIMGYLFFRNSRLKSRHKNMALEQRLFRSQMNPHFIFNSLIAIQSYIYQKDPVSAGDFLAKFADLVRMILESSRSEFVLFSKEINALDLYLQLQNLRFENKFDYQIEVDETIDKDNVSIPPMLAQPFIENAIEHGLRFKKDKGLLQINYRFEGNKIIFSIEDNGIGREKAKELNKKKEHLSLAINITKERLAILSKKFKHRFNLEITDLKNKDGNSRGTLVKFVMPCKVLKR
jgi:tetratricopeptide (TPR) repeat protein